MEGEGYSGWSLLGALVLGGVVGAVAGTVAAEPGTDRAKAKAYAAGLAEADARRRAAAEYKRNFPNGFDWRAEPWAKGWGR